MVSAVTLITPGSTMHFWAKRSQLIAPNQGSSTLPLKQKVPSFTSVLSTTWLSFWVSIRYTFIPSLLASFTVPLMVKLFLLLQLHKEATMAVQQRIVLIFFIVIII